MYAPKRGEARARKAGRDGGRERERMETRSSQRSQEVPLYIIGSVIIIPSYTHSPLVSAHTRWASPSVVLNTAEAPLKPRSTRAR